VVLISAHFEQLDSLQPVRDVKDVAALRNLQLTIQSHISALETLEKGKTTYGSLLGTKLIKLVPYKLQEKWSEVETNDSTAVMCKSYGDLFENLTLRRTLRQFSLFLKFTVTST
jgi:hypothetical protein